MTFITHIRLLMCIDVIWYQYTELAKLVNTQVRFFNAYDLKAMDSKTGFITRSLICIPTEARPTTRKTAKPSLRKANPLMLTDNLLQEQVE